MTTDLIEELRGCAARNGMHICDQAATALEAKERGNAELRNALQLLYSWANNWDSEFMDDPDWKNRDFLIIQAALATGGK